MTLSQELASIFRQNLHIQMLICMLLLLHFQHCDVYVDLSWSAGGGRRQSKTRACLGCFLLSPLSLNALRCADPTPTRNQATKFHRAMADPLKGADTFQTTITWSSPDHLAQYPDQMGYPASIFVLFFSPPRAVHHPAQEEVSRLSHAVPH